MDGNGELMEPEGPVAQSHIRVNVSKNNLKCTQALVLDETKIFTTDQRYSRTIVPSLNNSCCKEDIEKKTTQIDLTSTSPLKGRRSLGLGLEHLKSESVVNGMVNGLDLTHNVDLKHDISLISNGSTDGPRPCSSQCDKSEICNGNDRPRPSPTEASVPRPTSPMPSVVLVTNHKCVTNSLNNSKEESRSSEIGLCEKKNVDVEYVSYKSELQMPDIMRLIQKDLSEPYSIYTYRYFIHNWPKLCFLAMDGNECVGAIVCKLDVHRKVVKRGYIAMLAVDEKYRKRKIGSNLVLKAIRAMVADDADEVVLETEITNRPALRLYENLGFVRDKRLFRYYLNGVDALRLKLWLR